MTEPFHNYHLVNTVGTRLAAHACERRAVQLSAQRLPDENFEPVGARGGGLRDVR